MIDDTRLKYIWTDRAEQYFQHLRRIDEIVWRKKIGKKRWLGSLQDDTPTYYYALIDGKQYKYYRHPWGVFSTHPEDYVYRDLLKALQEREFIMEEVKDDEEK